MSSRNPYSRADPRTLAARAKGYPARSVFKLQEIDQKCRLLKPGQRVLDLGAAPGSWSLYVAERVGQSGRLLAVDLQSITQEFPSWVRVERADAFALDGSLHDGLAPYDLVLSDMAPKTGGDKFTNAARSYELFQAALQVATHFGKPGSGFVAKLFMGADFQAARAELQSCYTTCKVMKPNGTRGNSVEVFLVGQERKA